MQGEGKKWSDIIKSLPFDDGPSATRWVVLSVSLGACIACMILTVCIGWVYVRDPAHHFDALLGAFVSGVFTAMFAFAISALKRKHELDNNSPDNPNDTSA